MPSIIYYVYNAFGLRVQALSYTEGNDTQRRGLTARAISLEMHREWGHLHRLQRLTWLVERTKERTIDTML